MSDNSKYLWWQTGVVYQIYPRSFMDANGDGIGDLPGVIQRLDYLKEILGVDAIWISPIYPSPMKDFGYDVSDYCGIHPMFGSMANFDRLLEETHKRGMKLLLDLVPNHTSDEHPWFLESRSSRNNPKRDWYFWRDPLPSPANGRGAGGEDLPPNNWLSCFGGPAWEWDERTGQYYLHTFAKEQPDLDFRNPEVVEAMLDSMRFWLDKGVDGFRVDVITGMIKDALLRDEPANPAWDGVEPFASLQHIHSSNLPEVHEIIRRMRALVDSYPQRVLIGEIFALPNAELVKYYGANLDECHLPFNFGLIWIPWTLEAVRGKIEDYEAALPPGAWPNWVLGNHDQPRIATRAGRDRARAAAMLLLTLRGTPTWYNGDELGMENVTIPPELVQDPPAVNQPELAELLGRDPERTPMQWDDSPNAGFTSAGARPWLPLAADYKQVNVARQLEDPRSFLNFFRQLMALRKSSPALTVGSYRSLELGSPEAQANCFVYERQAEDQRLLVALNFSGREQALGLSLPGNGTILLSTGLDREGEIDLSKFSLAPNQGCLILL
ncbi:MAG: DUF3459 domain-containing protein [Chloroflexi bacterium]|nr:DUF3459 domain-containing protein [Chloroflexota bacterium]